MNWLGGALAWPDPAQEHPNSQAIFILLRGSGLLAGNTKLTKVLAHNDRDFDK